MHPRNAIGFEWDWGNERELAAHQIAPWEVEEVFWNGPDWARNKKDRSGDWKMIGRTNGGRPLTVIVLVREETEELRAITGWRSL